jgi:hypothetical protein
MRRTYRWGFACALLGTVMVAGCAEEEQTRLPRSLLDHVQVSRSEPGAACRSVGAVEARGDDGEGLQYESAYDSLRGRARARGANYVVIDSVVSVPVGRLEPLVRIQGRAYTCRLGAPVALRTPAPVATAPAPTAALSAAAAQDDCASCGSCSDE